MNEILEGCFQCGLDGCVFYFDNGNGTGQCGNPESMYFEEEIAADTTAPFYIVEGEGDMGEADFTIGLDCFAGNDDIEADA